MNSTAESFKQGNPKSKDYLVMHCVLFLLKLKEGISLPGTN